MNSTILVRFSALLLAVIFGGIVLHAPFIVFFGSRLPEYDLFIKSWKEILLGLVLVAELIIVTRQGKWRELMSDLVMRLIAAYSLLHILLLGWQWQGAAAAAAGILIDLRYLLFFTLVYVLLRLAPWYRLPLLIVSAFGAMVVVVFGFLQLFLPRDILRHIGYGPETIQPYLTVDNNPAYVRINSTLRGPNPVGAYAGTVLALMLAILARQARRLKNPSRTIGFWFVALCAAVTLWCSYSRSAWIGALVSIGLVAVIAWGKAALRHIKWLSVGIVALAVTVGLVATSQEGFIDNVIHHDDPTMGAEVTSDQAHLSSLQNGIDHLLHNPLGDGVGSTGSASMLSEKTHIVENQYLFISHETGWLGLGLFVAIFVLVLARAWHDRRDWLALGVFASGVGLAIIGLIQPVWADDTVAIVWWGLAAIAYVGVKSKDHGRKSSQQKTT